MSASTDVQTAAGATIALSATLPATHDAAGFGALSFTDLGLVTDAGTIPGRNYNEVSFSPLSEREVAYRKGSYEQDQQTIELADSITDAGQILAKAGVLADECYAVSITYQNGDVDYYTALILTFTKNVGTVDNIITRSMTTRPQGDTVEVDTP